MTQLTYLDSSGLLRYTDGLVANPSPRQSLIKPVIDGIVGDQSRQLACSEITIVEVHSNQTTQLRSSDLADYDEAWYAQALAAIRELCASGRLAVLPLPPRAIEHALAMVTAATTIHGRGLRAWDALHLHVAAHWAHSEGAGVEVVTTDTDMDVLDVLFGANASVSWLNLDVAAGTGEGYDRRNT